jgi:hypothetical protein
MKAMFAVQLRTTLGKFHKTSHEIHLEYVYAQKKKLKNKKIKK